MHVGDPVTCYFYSTCGHCRWCRENRATICQNQNPRVGYQVDGGYAELIKLPGVGRYTAGAVASFAYERPVAAVDTNVGRVIRRVFLGKKQMAVGSRRIWTIAQELVPSNGKTAWRFNQAMMELGALVCTARKPRCPECPVRVHCKDARRRGLAS